VPHRVFILPAFFPPSRFGKLYLFSSRKLIPSFVFPWMSFPSPDPPLSPLNTEPFADVARSYVESNPYAWLLLNREYTPLSLSFSPVPFFFSLSEEIKFFLVPFLIALRRAFLPFPIRSSSQPPNFYVVDKIFHPVPPGAIFPRVPHYILCGIPFRRKRLVQFSPLLQMCPKVQFLSKYQG